jgi:hypothetical protein
MKWLHVHLNSKHAISGIKKVADSNEADKATAAKQLKRGDTLENYFVTHLDENSLSPTLAWMTACDSIPFLVFTN